MKLRIVALLLVFAALSIFAIAKLVGNMSARATPSALEERAARTMRRLVIPSNVRKMHNPVPMSAEVLREARIHFADHCASCHGNDGAGHTSTGQGLYPPAPDLRAWPTQNLSDGEMFWAIENGIRFTGMPAFATPGYESDSWKLVHFVRHLPRISEEEVRQMETYNPKSSADRAEEQEEEKFLRGDKNPSDLNIGENQCVR